MASFDVDACVVQLLPQTLADRALEDGRTFTRLHLRHLWALLSLHAGEYVDEALLAALVFQHLPPHVLMENEVAAPAFDRHR